MEALIPLLPALTPLFNLVIYPVYRHFMEKFDAQEREIKALKEKIHDLEVTIYAEFCRKSSCDTMASEILNLTRSQS